MYLQHINNVKVSRFGQSAGNFCNRRPSTTRWYWVFDSKYERNQMLKV
jgi:hypothetical protein